MKTLLTIQLVCIILMLFIVIENHAQKKWIIPKEYRDSIMTSEVEITGQAIGTLWLPTKPISSVDRSKGLTEETKPSLSYQCDVHTTESIVTESDKKSFISDYDYDFSGETKEIKYEFLDTSCPIVTGIMYSNLCIHCAQEACYIYHGNSLCKECFEKEKEKQ